MEITEEEFESYVSVQKSEIVKSGIIKMWDIKNVMALTELSKEKVIHIMQNYGELKEKYKEV